MTNSKYILLALLIAVPVLFFLSGAGDVITLENFRHKQAEINAYYNAHPMATGILYVSLYILLTSLSLPVATVLTLIGGAVFGFYWGLILVSLASSLGATCAFLLARYLFHDAVQQRYAEQLKPVNDGVRNDGAAYLFLLRMAPVFPFFIVNATMAMTPIRTAVFFPVSLVGMLPATAIFVNAGAQLSRIKTAEDILSLRVLASLALIGVFPLLMKKFFHRYKRGKVLAAPE
jgi:uncharacterized membrane protein YdjX (TVP38/TMEM64 family)